MSFKVDKATLEELNLTGKYKPDSIFNLFNKVKSAGGERLLENMLLHPLTDHDQINERTIKFRWFNQTRFSFPWEGQTIDQFGEWLKTDVQRTPIGSNLHTISLYVKSILVHDERHVLSCQGLLATARALSILDSFVYAFVESPPWMKEQVEKVQSLLGEPKVRSLIQLEKQGTHKLTVSQIATHTYYLKTRLGRQMQDLLDFLYELDVYISVAQVAKDNHLGFALALPRFRNMFEVKGVRHPTLMNAVGNELDLNDGHNLLFLTGANMAGKSTLMKSLGIAFYLAHAGFPIPADEMTFSVKDGLFTSINVPDNIQLGYSHFYAEVRRVRQAAELVAEGGQVMVIFDELFKGTNVKDAYEGTLCVTEALSAYRQSFFVISTHIIEVAEPLMERANILFKYMPTIMNKEKPSYTFKLAKGVTSDRQGMTIIRNEGILDLLS